MKAKHVFTALGLAFVMGAGVVAGVAANKKVEPAKAWGSSYWANQYVVGSFAESNWSNFLPFSKGASGDYERTITLEAGDQFKFTNQANWDGVIVARNWDQIVNQGTAPNCWATYTEDAGGTDHNFKIINAGTYRVYMEADAVEGSWGEAEYGIHIEEVVGTQSVDVYVDGTLRGTESIAEGALPANPTYDFGKKFDGWYTTADYQASSKVDEVTSATTALYGRIVDAENRYFLRQSGWIRSSTFFGGNSDKAYLYAWNDCGTNNEAWPGEDQGTMDVFGGEGFINVPENAKFIIVNQTKSLQTVDIDPTGIANDDEIIILDTVDSQGHYNVTWKSLLDEPAENGYYLLGSKTSFKYAGAPKLTDIPKDANDNIAVLYDYAAEEGETIKVKYFNLGEGKNVWSYTGTAACDLGGPDADSNFEFAKDAHVDIFAKWVEVSTDVWDLQFFVAEHVERHTVAVTNVLFEGKTKTGTEAGTDQLASEGGDFTPIEPTKSDYVFKGFYTDVNCVTEYVPAEITTDGVTLYAKFIRNGYYVAGDAAFAGSINAAWNVEGAVRLNSENPNDPENFAEGTIVIPASAETTPVEVKPMQYSAENEHNWLYFELGATYSFASIETDQGNLAFTKGGTYAVYVKLVNNVPTVWLNEGLNAFNTKFLTDVGGVCNGILNGSKDLDNLKAVWLDVKAAYESLSADEKAEYTSLTINDGNENGSDLEKVIAKYSYIVHKYGTANCEDFIWGQTYVAQSNGFNLINNNNAMIIIAVSISVVAISAVGLFFIIRRKRLVK